MELVDGVLCATRIVVEGNIYLRRKNNGRKPTGDRYNTNRPIPRALSMKTYKVEAVASASFGFRFYYLHFWFLRGHEVHNTSSISFESYGPDNTDDTLRVGLSTVTVLGIRIV